jgi:RHS repeat-associated protein
MKAVYNQNVIITFTGTLTQNFYCRNMRSVAFNAKELDEENGMYYYEARYYNPPMFISRDPLFEKYPNISPYAYCANNPVILVDPNGMDWYRSDETGATFWQKGNDNSVEKDGVKYRNIGETYSVYSDGMRTDYGNNNLDVISTSEVDPALNLEGGQYIPNQFTTDNGQMVNVGFSATADNAINSDAVSLLIKSINEANNNGANISSIKVSSTTNHPSNAAKSAHTVANGAKAIDISRINNTPVSPTDRNSPVLQQFIRSTSGWRENYGPAVIQKMHNGNAIPAPWARNIKGGHYDHIHFSVH